MRNTVLVILTMALATTCSYAVDGQVLINQSTVMAAGGFPYTITQPGSYKLSGNLTVPGANTNGIVITTDNVTLDLNGFSIIGPVACSDPNGGIFVTACSPASSGIGVYAPSKPTNGNPITPNSIAVMNGSVRGFGFGIALGGVLSYSNIVKGVQAQSNSTIGIAVRGVITNCTATGNGLAGITGFGVMTGNVATGNGDTGLGGTGTISGNTAIGNGRVGIGVNCNGAAGVVEGNTSFANGLVGIENVVSACLLVNNAAN